MSDLPAAQLEFLRGTQNPDGGWGFFAGKRQSWLEPTAYALIALHSDPASATHFERGWNLMRSWQLPDGSWKPCAAVAEPHWTTSLCVTLHCLRGVHDQPFGRGVAWLVGTSGIENGLKFRIAHFLRPSIVELDPSFKAWPWRPGNASWIEPTAHALVALKKAARIAARPELRARIESGEKMIIERLLKEGMKFTKRFLISGTLCSGVDDVSIPCLVACACSIGRAKAERSREEDQKGHRNKQ